MKVYITFGQEHIHRVNGEVFDKDCVAVIHAKDHAAAREVAVELFGLKFCTSYDDSNDKDWWEKSSHYFPRGLIEVEA